MIRQLFGSIGTTKSYETREAYLRKVKTRAEPEESVAVDRIRIREKISLFDVNPKETFEGQISTQLVVQ